MYVTWFHLLTLRNADVLLWATPLCRSTWGRLRCFKAIQPTFRVLSLTAVAATVLVQTHITTAFSIRSDSSLSGSPYHCLEGLPTLWHHQKLQTLRPDHRPKQSIDCPDTVDLLIAMVCTTKGRPSAMQAHNHSQHPSQDRAPKRYFCMVRQSYGLDTSEKVSSLNPNSWTPVALDTDPQNNCQKKLFLQAQSQQHSLGLPPPRLSATITEREPLIFPCTRDPNFSASKRKKDSGMLDTHLMPQNVE